MAEIVVSYRVTRSGGKPYGQRVWDDGRVENFRTDRRVKGQDGVVRTESLPPDWYPITTLSAVQVQAVQKVVESAQLADLPSRLDAKVDPDLEAEQAEWQVQTNDGLKTIEVEFWNPAEGQQKRLLEVLQKMGEIVLKAQSGSEDAP